MKIFKYLVTLFFVSALALTGCASAEADPPERSESSAPLTVTPSAAPEPSTPKPPLVTPSPAPETTAPAPEPEPTETERTQTIVYEITGDGGTAAQVSWGTMNGLNGYGIEQAIDAPLPFRVEVPLEELGRYESNIFTLNAQDAGFGTSISCKISWKESGVVLMEQTSTGPYSVVMCSK